MGFFFQRLRAPPFLKLPNSLNCGRAMKAILASVRDPAGQNIMVQLLKSFDFKRANIPNVRAVYVCDDVLAGGIGEIFVSFFGVGVIEICGDITVFLLTVGFEESVVNSIKIRTNQD